jgi:hypothetical protein
VGTAYICRLGMCRGLLVSIDAVTDALNKGVPNGHGMRMRVCSRFTKEVARYSQSTS